MPPIIIAGPCLLQPHTWDEDKAVAQKLEEVTPKRAKTYFKASWRKANRTRHGDSEGFSTIGFSFEYFEEIAQQHPDVGIITDVHEESDIYALLNTPNPITAIQIPAFLSRQNGLIKTAMSTGLDVFVKKGVWTGEKEVEALADKLADWKREHNEESVVGIIDRGMSGGMLGTEGGNYAVDLLSFVHNSNTAYDRGIKYLFDLTHTYGQRVGERKRGTYRQLIDATRELGADGWFCEVSADPEKALSDSNRQIHQGVFSSLLLSMTHDEVR